MVIRLNNLFLDIGFKQLIVRYLFKLKPNVKSSESLSTNLYKNFNKWIKKRSLINTPAHESMPPIQNSFIENSKINHARGLSLLELMAMFLGKIY